jgi:hypothetical protein
MALPPYQFHENLPSGSKLLLGDTQIDTYTETNWWFYKSSFSFESRQKIPTDDNALRGIRTHARGVNNTHEWPCPQRQVVLRIFNMHYVENLLFITAHASRTWQGLVDGDLAAVVSLPLDARRRRPRGVTRERHVRTLPHDYVRAAEGVVDVRWYWNKT